MESSPQNAGKDIQNKCKKNPEDILATRSMKIPGEYGMQLHTLMSDFFGGESKFSQQILFYQAPGKDLNNLKLRNKICKTPFPLYLEPFLHPDIIAVL